MPHRVVLGVEQFGLDLLRLEGHVQRLPLAKDAGGDLVAPLPILGVHEDQHEVEAAQQGGPLWHYPTGVICMGGRLSALKGRGKVGSRDTRYAIYIHVLSCIV